MMGTSMAEIDEALRMDGDEDRLLGMLRAQRAAQQAEGIPSADTRIDRLRRLLALLERHEAKIVEAAASDFGYRSPQQTYFVEIMTTAKPIREAIRNIRRWMRPERRKAGFPFNIAGASAKVHYQPLGVVGCISPWNFPVNLTFAPLAGIIAAGNRAMVKPSEVTPALAELIDEMLSGAFDSAEISVVTGDAEVARMFSGLPFDHLIYTGGEAVAKSIMRAASENLVPLTLELGGKSPVIIGKGVDMTRAADRIMFGKVFNAGQICLAPDYVFVPEAEIEGFLSEMRSAIERTLPRDRGVQDFVGAVNSRHAERLRGYVDEAREGDARIIQFEWLGNPPAG